MMCPNSSLRLSNHLADVVALFASLIAWMRYSGAEPVCAGTGTGTYTGGAAGWGTTITTGVGGTGVAVGTACWVAATAACTRSARAFACWVACAIAVVVAAAW